MNNEYVAGLQRARNIVSGIISRARGYGGPGGPDPDVLEAEQEIERAIAEASRIAPRQTEFRFRTEA